MLIRSAATEYFYACIYDLSTHIGIFTKCKVFHDLSIYGLPFQAACWDIGYRFINRSPLRGAPLLLALQFVLIDASNDVVKGHACVAYDCCS